MKIAKEESPQDFLKDVLDMAKKDKKRTKKRKNDLESRPAKKNNTT